jgi:hypothetical protein
VAALDGSRAPSVGVIPDSDLAEVDTVEVIVEIPAAALRESNPPDEADLVGPTVFAIPVRRELAAARLAHALQNAREAEPLIEEAAALLSTVVDFDAEGDHLAAALGEVRAAIAVLTSRFQASLVDPIADGPDLKTDPSSDEIANWISFELPVQS